jgi:hypothetical protein
MKKCRGSAGRPDIWSSCLNFIDFQFPGSRLRSGLAVVDTELAIFLLGANGMSSGCSDHQPGRSKPI